MVKGILNEKTVDLLQVYYGNAIRWHSNDLEGMKQACWAVFYHSISTDEKPLHHCCPEGADSWCKFQRAVALHQNAPPHSTRIPADLEQYIKPVFAALCTPELLEKCLLGATQNRNESFNNLVWACALGLNSLLDPLLTLPSVKPLSFSTQVNRLCFQSWNE